jgi:hypothetical protein
MNQQPADAKPIGLVIEDNPDQNLVFTMALNKAGYSTESLYNLENPASLLFQSSASGA